MSDLVDELIAAHVGAGRAGAADFAGADAQLLAAVESDLGAELPPLWRRLLARAGAKSPLLVGTDLGAAAIPQRTSDARALLAEGGLELPADAVVIAAHQGYDVWWVRAALGDASPVWGYREGDADLEQRHPDLADFVRWLFEHS